MSERACPKCGGSGTILLAPYLEETLKLISLSAKTPAYIADKLDVSMTTVNNRLKRLIDYGLVKRAGPHPIPGGGATYLYRKVRS